MMSPFPYSRAMLRLPLLLLSLSSLLLLLQGSNALCVPRASHLKASKRAEKSPVNAPAKPPPSTPSPVNEPAKPPPSTSSPVNAPAKPPPSTPSPVNEPAKPPPSISSQVNAPANPPPSTPSPVNAPAKPPPSTPSPDNAPAKPPPSTPSPVNEPTKPPPSISSQVNAPANPPPSTPSPVNAPAKPPPSTSSPDNAPAKPPPSTSSPDNAPAKPPPSTPSPDNAPAKPSPAPPSPVNEPTKAPSQSVSSPVNAPTERAGSGPSGWAPSIAAHVPVVETLGSAASGVQASVAGLCKQTNHPEACVLSVQPYVPVSGHLSPADMLLMQIKATVAKVDSATAHANQLLTSSTVTPYLRSCLETCKDLYGDMKANFDDAKKALAASDLDLLKTMISATISDVSTCEDGFLEMPGLPLLMGSYGSELSKLTSNCLAIADLV